LSSEYSKLPQERKDRLNAAGRRYYKAHAEIRKRQSREWHARHKEQDYAINRKWAAANPRREWCVVVISNHRKTGYEILFEREELEQLAKRTDYCFLCGAVLEWNINRRVSLPNSPSLDRIDNTQRLALNDVQIICHSCNSTKQNRTMAEFIEYCKLIAIQHRNPINFGGMM
jgi:hypothetical protein